MFYNGNSELRRGLRTIIITTFRLRPSTASTCGCFNSTAACLAMQRKCGGCNCAFGLGLKRFGGNCVCSLLVCFLGVLLLPPRAKMSDEPKMSFSDRLLPRNYIPQLKDLAKQTHKARRARHRMHFMSIFVVLKASCCRCCIPSLRLPCGRCLRTL